MKQNTPPDIPEQDALLIIEEKSTPNIPVPDYYGPTPDSSGPTPNFISKSNAIINTSLDIIPGLLNADVTSQNGQANARIYLIQEAEILTNLVHRQARYNASVTADMISDVQHMLRLFGVPYIIAPMEAEAQCAALELAKLTNGTITDDSDIFLFGGETVYRRFASRHKEGEIYNATTIKSELGNRGLLHFDHF